MKRNCFNAWVIVTITLFLSSCAATCCIRGHYNPINNTTTKLDYDRVWDKVIDFFAESGIPIGVLDKSSGLITATSVEFGNKVVGVENREGYISNSQAWFVVPYNMNAVAGRAKCSFNVRLRKLDNGGTNIQVNLSNLVGYYDYKAYGAIIQNKEERQCVSTGKFEQSLINYLK